MATSGVSGTPAPMVARMRVISICAECKQRRDVAEAVKRIKRDKGGRPSTRAALAASASVAAKTGWSPGEARKALSALAESISEALTTDGSFCIPGVVTLKRKYVPHRLDKEKIVNGKRIFCKAKPAGQKLAAAFAKPFKEAVGAM